jgi:hypothetical protein
MSFGWVAAGAVVGGAVIGANATKSAADTQAAASNEASQASLQGTRESIAAQERAFNKQLQLQEPFREAGLKGQNELMTLLGLSKYTGARDYGALTKPFTGQDMYKDPGYAFRLNEGVKALDRSAAARGGLLGGNQLRGVTEFGQDYGSQEYQNAFNRYQVERQARLNPLQSLAGQAQTSSNTLTNAAGSLGSGTAAALTAGSNAAAANLINQGNIRASGYMGTANVISNALNQGVNYYGQQQMLNRFFPQGGGGGGGGFPTYSIGGFTNTFG